MAPRFDDMIRFGRVIEVDLAEALLRVEIGDIETNWIPWASLRAGETTIWSPPSVDEQIVLLCHDGDILAAVTIGALFSGNNAPAGDSKRELIRFKDGAIIAYDPETHKLDAILPDGGEITLTGPKHIRVNADRGVTINGPVEINGPVTINEDVTLNGKMTASDDVIASGKSLKSHKHGGVQAGSAQSGVPV